MQKFMKVPFKMSEIFPNTLGGGLEIWASIDNHTIRTTCKTKKCQNGFHSFKQFNK